MNNVNEADDSNLDQEALLKKLRSITDYAAFTKSYQEFVSDQRDKLRAEPEPKVDWRQSLKDHIDAYKQSKPQNNDDVSYPPVPSDVNFLEIFFGQFDGDSVQFQAWFTDKFGPDAWIKWVTKRRDESYASVLLAEAEPSDLDKAKLINNLRRASQGEAPMQAPQIAPDYPDVPQVDPEEWRKLLTILYKGNVREFSNWFVETYGPEAWNSWHGNYRHQEILKDPYNKKKWWQTKRATKVYDRKGEYGDEIVCKYHSTEIVRVSKDRLILDTGGEKGGWTKPSQGPGSITTMRRMNEFAHHTKLCPKFRLWTHKYEWFVMVPCYDGVKRKYKFGSKNTSRVVIDLHEGKVLEGAVFLGAVQESLAASLLKGFSLLMNEAVKGFNRS